MVSSAKLEIVSQEYNEDESSKETSLLESIEISLNSNQIINIGNETINSSSPTLTSHHSCPSTQQQQSFSRNHDNFLNVHTSQNIQPIQPTQGPTPAATPTQKLSPRLSISEQNISQSHPELRSLLYSHQHLPLQQQQYLEHLFVEDQYRLQQMIQSQASLGQMVPANYCPQQHQQYQILADCGQVQIEEPSTSFLQPYQPQQPQPSHSQNSHSVLRHQNNVQRKSQPISESERQRRRLERNRVAARQCRERKKVYVSNLESKVTRLEEENAKLRCEVLELSAKLLQNPVDAQENERLYILTEELKARLYAQEQQYQQSNQLSQEQQEQQKQEQKQEQQKQEQQKQEPQQQQQYVNNNSLPLDDDTVKNEDDEL
jgi:hypothetical protein